MGKKIIVRFCGSDVRDMEVDRQMAVRHGLPWTEYGMRNTLAALRPKLHYLRTCERYAHILIGASNMSLRPSLSGTSWLFQPDSAICNPSQRRHPVILHAPSNRAAKGTAVLLQIFDALRSAGLQFGVKLIENIPHEDMPQEYAAADIFCNSLFYSGRATWEALAAGCVVADNCDYQAYLERNRSYAPENLRALGVPPSAEGWWWRALDQEKFISQSPIVEITPDTATEVLGRLILDWPRRQMLAQQAQDYVKLLSAARGLPAHSGPTC